MENLVIAILTVLGVVAVILFVRLMVANRQKELAEVQNRLMRDQVAAQNRTADLGERMLQEQEEEAVLATTPIPAATPARAPAAGGEGALMAGAGGQISPRARVAEAEVARLKAELEEKNKDPVLASYEADLKASQTDLEVASMEFAGVRTDARAAELSLKSAMKRRKTQKDKDFAERVDEELEERYGPKVRVRAEVPAVPVAAAEPVVATPASTQVEPAPMRTQRLTINGQVVGSGQARVNVPNGYVDLGRAFTGAGYDQGTEVTLTVHPNIQGATVDFRGAGRRGPLQGVVTMGSDRTVTVTITPPAAATDATDGTTAVEELEELLTEAGF